MRTLAAAIVALASIGSTACSSGRDLTSSPAGPSRTSTSTAKVTTLVSVTDSITVTAGGTGTFNWAGQSITLPAGKFSNIRFNWYTFKGDVTAFGTLYLLKQEFLGIPAELRPGMAGYVARADAGASGEYVFAPEVVLDGSTRYWVYTDKQGSFATSFDTDIYRDGDLYLTGYPTYPFHRAHASGRMVNGVLVPAPDVYTDANFRLQGSTAK